MEKVPEVFGWSHGPYVICPMLREEIERLEPKTHKFRSIELVTNVEFQGSTHHGNYYIILSPPRVDAVVVADTKFSGGMGHEGFARSRSKESGMVFFSPTRSATCVLRAAAIAGRHLWQLPLNWQAGLFCSDELWRFYKQNKMKGWDIRKNLHGRLTALNWVAR